MLAYECGDDDGSVCTTSAVVGASRKSFNFNFCATFGPAVKRVCLRNHSNPGSSVFANAAVSSLVPYAAPSKDQLCVPIVAHGFPTSHLPSSCNSSNSDSIDHDAPFFAYELNPSSEECVTEPQNPPCSPSEQFQDLTSSPSQLPQDHTSSPSAQFQDHTSSPSAQFQDLTSSPSAQFQDLTSSPSELPQDLTSSPSELCLLWGDYAAESTDSPAVDEEFNKRLKTKLAAVRLGQAKFRVDVLKEFENKCVVTGCDCGKALQAAHIYAYCKDGMKGTKTNPKNGMPMRADVHSLFDANLLRVVSRGGRLFWWLDTMVTYLSDVHDKSCDAVFSDKERLEFLKRTDHFFVSS